MSPAGHEGGGGGHLASRTCRGPLSSGRTAGDGGIRGGIFPWAKFHVSNWCGIPPPPFFQCWCGISPECLWCWAEKQDSHEANTYGAVQFFDNSDF